MTFPLILTAALVLGMLTGRTLYVDLRWLADLMLYIMLFFIGMEMAQKRKELLKDFREVGFLSIALPMVTVIGSMIGGMAMGFLIPDLTSYSGMVVTSGCGWYSLTGPYLAKFNPQYGLLGFLANFMREITMLLFYPLLIRWIDPIAAITMGGATTMDSTLPLVRNLAGPRAGVVAFAHGFIVSLIVPFLLMVETRFLF